jgi:hypothetical protein
LTFCITVLLTLYLDLNLEEFIRDFVFNLTFFEVINKLIEDLGGLICAEELREFSLDIIELANLKFLLLGILGLLFVS